jgi:PTH1 family peptidyl-tRNA hydrolase
LQGSEAFRKLIRLIAGLGNPGVEYAGTRHNIGFAVLDRLADRHKIPIRKRAMRSVMGDGSIEGKKLILAKPMTYMNLSGEAVGAIARMYKLAANEILVLVDDIALPTGKLRLRLQGSSGGHNGLESIERHLHSDEYLRIRIGVGSAAAGRMVDHVLGKIGREEKEVIEIAIERAVDAIECALRSGFETAMNLYNRDQ